MKPSAIFCLLALTALCSVSTPTHAQAPAKKTVATVYCAVTDERIGDAKSAASLKTVNGKTYYLCCPGCAPKFDAAPAKYAKIADLRTEKRMIAARLAKIDAELKTTQAAPATLAPVAASAPLHCAITDEAIASVKDAAGSQVYNGKTYYFCCPGCVTKFAANPAKYVADADKRAASRTN